MTRNATILVGVGIIAAGAIGYAAYTKKKDEPTGQPVQQTKPDWVPQELADRYKACWNGPCTPQEFTAVENALNDLIQAQAGNPQNQATVQWFYDQLAARYPDYTTPQESGGYSATSPGLGINWPGGQTFNVLDSPPPLPGITPPYLVFQYSECWANVCTQQTFDSLIANLNSLAFNNPSVSPQIATAVAALFDRRIRQTSGVVGRHTGGCSCQARQEEIGTGACCDACERGEECEECGEHKQVG